MDVVWVWVKTTQTYEGFYGKLWPPWCHCFYTEGWITDCSHGENPSDIHRLTPNKCKQPFQPEMVNKYGRKRFRAPLWELCQQEASLTGEKIYNCLPLELHFIVWDWWARDWPCYIMRTNMHFICKGRTFEGLRVKSWFRFVRTGFRLGFQLCFRKTERMKKINDIRKGASPVGLWPTWMITNSPIHPWWHQNTLQI